jgi:hypothetical protein
LSSVALGHREIAKPCVEMIGARSGARHDANARWANAVARFTAGGRSPSLFVIGAQATATHQEPDMPTVDATTTSATRPSEWGKPRLDNRFFAVVLAAIFAVLVTMLSGFVGEVSDQHAPRAAADAKPSLPTTLVTVGSIAGHK